MFGANLKKYRRLKGYSQGEFATKLYVTRQCVSKWEKGITQPDLETLQRIGELLDVSIDMLLKGKDDATREHQTDLNKSFLIANLLVALFCTLSFATLWRYLPNTVPAHWSYGKIDRYGDRAEIFLNLISVVVFFITDVMLFVALKRAFKNKTIEFAHCVMTAFAHCVIIICQVAYLIFIVALYANHITSILSFLTCISACIILCVSIAMHPKIAKQNQWLGVRTRETLSDAVVWNKTNTLACYLFVCFSFAIIVANMIVTSVWACTGLAAYVIPAVISIAYSKYISKSVNEESSKQNNYNNN